MACVVGSVCGLGAFSHLHSRLLVGVKTGVNKLGTGQQGPKVTTQHVSGVCLGVRCYKVRPCACGIMFHSFIHSVVQIALVGG